ncbi:MAG TPA: hypothetical protein VK139_07275 [Microbacteriaceae bacterium]|nr:hypothetical protein [Microbacteriaceae bacterium]
MKRLERLIASPIALLLTLLVAIPLASGLVSLVLVELNRNTDSAGPSPTETVNPNAPEQVPVFVPGGSASQNKPWFDYTNKKTVASFAPPIGQNFIDGLVAAGFDKTAMLVTPDTTAANLQADSIQFSVQVGELCLVGQYGTGSQGYQSRIFPVVPGIGCLLGKTRPIE